MKFDDLEIAHEAQNVHVVVVGAGIAGCAAAFHLLRSGVGKVTIIDPVEPGGSTTSAGAGFVSHWSAGMIDMGPEGLTLQQYGLDFYRALAELGQDIGYRARGTLMLSLTPEGHEQHVRPVLESVHAPKEMQALEPAGIEKLTQGLVDTSRLYSAAYNPHGIQLETGKAIAVLGDLIREAGANMLIGSSVAGVEEHANGVRVTLDEGDVIEADAVILAAGAWNNSVLEQTGWKLPLLRVVATRILTDNRGLPGVSPTIQCRELRLWLRESYGSVLWGTAMGYRPFYQLAGDIKREPPAGHQNFPELVEALHAHQKEVLEDYFPSLVGSSVEECVQGIACYTPDNALLVGRVPGTKRIVVAGGDNESGVTHGPGMGRLAAEIATGRKVIADPHRFRLDRFEPAAFPDEAAVAAALEQHRVLRFREEA